MMAFRDEKSKSNLSGKKNNIVFFDKKKSAILNIKDIKTTFRRTLPVYLFRTDVLPFFTQTTAFGRNRVLIGERGKVTRVRIVRLKDISPALLKLMVCAAIIGGITNIIWRAMSPGRRFIL